MKTILICLFSFGTFITYGQPSNTEGNIFRCKIIFTEPGGGVTGVLYALSDSSVQLISLKAAKNGSADQYRVQTVQVNTIEQMKFRKVGAIKRGAIVGGILGLIGGGVIGNSSYTPCDDTQSLFGSDCDWELFNRTDVTILGALGGAIVGGGLGVLIGSSNKLIDIKGRQDLYEMQKSKLSEYVLLK